MNRIPIELDTFHHVYNRGTEKRIIFLDDEDRERFMLYVDVLNNQDLDTPSRLEVAGMLDDFMVQERLVDIISLCLMPNHYHMLIYERTGSGMSKFMQRLGTAYTVYFNEKYEHSGGLFQGAYKNRLVEDETYLIKVVNYIHLNPIPLFNRNIDKNGGTVLDFLKQYRWSSLPSYLDPTDKVKWLQKSRLKEFVDLEDEYEAELIDAIDERMELTETLGKIAIEE